jgi:hypothetical protein
MVPASALVDDLHTDDTAWIFFLAYKHTRKNTLFLGWDTQTGVPKIIYYCIPEYYELIIKIVSKSGGFLLEHKMFLSEGYLPEKIKEILHGKGEIMNVVLINQGNAVRYEIIYRDTELTRYVIVFDITGTILEERVL